MLSKGKCFYIIERIKYFRMKKVLLWIISLGIIFIYSSTSALLSSTSCGGSAGQTYTSWAAANAGRTNQGSCSGGDGYLQPGSNVVTWYPNSGTSTWNCTGWNWSSYVVTATCSLTVTIAATTWWTTTSGTSTTTTTTTMPTSSVSCRLPVCRPNATIGVSANDVPPANASPLTTDELPSSLKLVRDYDTTLIADPTKRTELALPDGCQYSCNDGFKIWPLTATAESNTAGTFAKILTGWSGYTTPPTVTVSGGTCTTRPTGITTINSGGSIDSLTLTGAVNCTTAPIITISAPTDTVRRCVADQCLGFAKPTNATYCTDDTILAGHVDQLNTHRADTAGCTSNQKCEWFCPTDNPYFCETANTCVKTQNDCGDPVSACKTSAPSELKALVDYPLIQCDAINSSSSVSAASTATNANFKVTKLLAKAVNGVCPTNSSAYVPDLTGIVTNDKICVRLSYENSTPWAISNALITDSIPTGFTRVTNSTKNCLTPSGTSELCSDASGMGGAIGNSGWSWDNFSLTPHAGFYAIPTTQSTPTTMEMGRVPFLNMTHCNWFQSGATAQDSVYLNYFYTSTTGTEGPVVSDNYCNLNAVGGYTLGWWNGNHTRSVIGDRYYHYYYCNYNQVSTGNSKIVINSTIPSNSTTNPITTGCVGESGYLMTATPTYNDMFGQRYLQHSVCRYAQTGASYLWDVYYRSNISFTNTASTVNCPNNLSGYTMTTANLFPVDLLDTANGKWYIEYMVEATQTPSWVTLPNVTLTGTLSGNTTPETSTSNATINGTGGGIISTHFRYKITKNGWTTADTYTSPLFTVWTSIKHPTTFNTGTYTVTCLYGNSTNTDVNAIDYGMTPGTCTKTMTVNDTAQGCSRLYPYRGATLSDSLSSDAAFDASFRCGSRNPTTPLTETRAYRLQIGTTDPSWLLYDQNISTLFNGLAIWPVSTQTQNYTFTTGTDVSCAVKVGDGYSTNTSCQARTCIGSTCANPQSFIVVPSDEISCTNGSDITYDIGCNPASPDYVSCLQTFFETTGSTTSGTTTPTTVRIVSNGSPTDVPLLCTTLTPPGALWPVKTCTIDLPSGGMPVTILAGDVTNGVYSFQTTAYTLAKDTGKPTGTISYYTNYSNGVTLASDQYEYWQKQPVTAVITCTDKTTSNASGEQDGSGCACSQTLEGSATELQYWSQGVPSSNTNIGPDVMTYSRIMENNSGALSPVRVIDTANNISDQSFAPDFGIDSTPPILTATTSGSTVTLTFTDNHTGASGFWKPLSAFGDTLPTGVLKGTTASNNAIVYRIWPKTSLSTLEFGADCSPLPVKNTNYYKYKETPGPSTTQTLTLSSFDTANNVVAYCIQDNAGNINRGYYPNQVTGCFASTNMTTIPTLSPPTLATHYAPLLKTRLNTPTSATFTDNQKYGYSFSENSTDAGCFRGILSNNVTTLVTNQLNPKPTSTTTLSNWTTDLATIKNTTTPNTNGYYYYSYTGGTNNTLSITTSPTGTGTKSVVVEGGNIQINTNLEYTGTGKTLLLIARKNASGQGGNIYINPSVTKIDAIIIADGGAVMNGTTTSWVTDTKEWTTTSDVSLLAKRLTINGRIYSYNTRGGSLTPQASPGTDFDPIATGSGKYFDANVFHNNGTLTQAASYDLERLRVMLTDGNSQCTTHVNYQTFTTTNLPALLVKPQTYSGACSF